MSDWQDPQEIITVKEIDESLVEQLAEELSVSKTVSRVLICRGLDTFEKCKLFFRPDLSHLHDPFLFKDMQKAVDRILECIKNHEKIIIHGDYDVDGVTSTSLLLRAFRELDADCDFFLPNRLTEDYGISTSGIEELANQGASIIISVDCGITAIEAAQKAKELGVELIITDHHEPKEELPDAFAILNPKLEDKYPEKMLAGVGVAFKLVQALGKATGKDDNFWQKQMDIVALGTAADIVPLQGENRVIAKFGYEQIEKTFNEGLRKLMSIKEITSKRITTADVVFKLAPSINAAGRLGDAAKGVKLLTSDDPIEIETLATELHEDNVERQKFDRSVQDQAVAWVQQNVDLSKDFAIVAGSKKWHAGVIGISASKMVERYHRPAFLFSADEDGIAKGSGRSIRGVHLLKALDECKDLLISYGGHAAAAGAKIDIEKMPEFRKRFNDAVSKQVSIEDLAPHVIADAEVPVPAITPKMYRILDQMAPFGPFNMRPVFTSGKLRNRYAPRLVGEKHLKLNVTQEGQNMDAIAFNQGKRIDEIKKAESFRLAYTIEQNEWMGKVSLQMKVKGISI